LKGEKEVYEMIHQFGQKKRENQKQLRPLVKMLNGEMGEEK